MVNHFLSRLEQYSWRAQEDALNVQLPQFRTGFTVSPSSSSPETLVRLHFVHVRSPHANAVPLLLIPPFPASNLSFGHLIKHFTEPEGDVATAANQPFHLVIPALPGLGFSDALPNNVPAISTTARLLDSLMRRLSYHYYLTTNASAGSASPSGIDYKLARRLATHHSDSCLGTHLISPPLTRPKLKEAPVEWAKYSVARLTRAPVLGYRAEDFSAMSRSSRARSPPSSTSSSSSPSNKKTQAQTPSLDPLALREPNALAYALCDSPTGLLVYVLMILRLLDPRSELAPTEVINLTHLAWLPGPEAAMRFWAYCAHHSEEEEEEGKKAQQKLSKKRGSASSSSSTKPKVGITVFLGGDGAGGSGSSSTGAAQAPPPIVEDQPANSNNSYCYSCPSWANPKFDVVHAHRAPGMPGLLAWQRPEIIAAGVRGLAAALIKAGDGARLREDAAAAPSLPAASAAPLEQVVIGNDGNNNGGPASASASAPTASAVANPPRTPTHLAPPSSGANNISRLRPRREISDDTAVGSRDSLSMPAKDKDSSPAVSASIDFASLKTSPLLPPDDDDDDRMMAAEAQREVGATDPVVADAAVVGDGESHK